MIKKTFSLFLLLALFATPLASKADLDGDTSNATLSLSPQSGTYQVGDNFDVDILLDTNGQDVVVVSAYLNYDKDHFQVVEISGTDSSVFNMEAENDIDSSAGLIKITRNSPTPGVNTANGNVATITFQATSATSPSTDNFTFDFEAGGTMESNVILDDGQGTDVLSGVYNGRFAAEGESEEDLTGPVISSVGASSVTQSSAVIGWSTNEPANTQVEYGTTSLYGSETSLNSSLVTSHSVTLSGLSEGTTYYYRVRSSDEAGNLSTSGGHTFTTTDSSGQTDPYCGDGSCNNGETCSTCSADCGTCQTGGGDTGDDSICGDGTCDADETCSSCPSDCGSCGTTQINDGDLVRGVNQSKVYLIQNNLKRWITSGQAFADLGYSWSNVKVVSTDQLAGYPEGSSINEASDVDEGGQIDPSELQEGDLIRGPDGIKVYIINEYDYKRHIYNPDIFNLYGHLKWENIKAVSQDTLDSYQTSALFSPASSDSIYYLNETSVGALKRLLINENVFAGYDNKYNAVFNVMSEELDMYEDVQLVKASNDYKVYLIEGNTKRWITTGQVFNSRGYDSRKIVTVWPHELEEFTEGDPIE